MFEFQIVRYEGSDFPEEIIIELSSHEHPECSETIYHQECLAKDELKSEKELMQSPVSITAPGIISILLYMRNKELGVHFSSELLSDIRNVQYLPLYCPPREVDSLEELVESPRILIASSINSEETGEFYTNFSFYVYKKYVDLKRTSFIEEAEFSRKQKNFEFENLRLSNECSIQRALKDDKEEELETNKHRYNIIKGNMEAVVNDLESQRTALEHELEKNSKKLENFDKFSKYAEECIEQSYLKFEGLNKKVDNDVADLIKQVNLLKAEKCQSANKIQNLESSLRMLEQSLTLEKLRNSAKGMKESFYMTFKNVLAKETSGTFAKMVEEYELQVQNLKKKLIESLQCTQKLEEQLKSSHMSYEHLESSLKEKITCKSDKKRGIKQQLASIQEKLASKQQKLKEKKKELIQKNEEFTKERQKNQNSFTVAEQLWETERNNFLVQIENMKTQFLSEKKSLITQNEETIKDFEIIIRTNKETFEAEKIQSFQEFDKKFKQLTQKFESEKKKISDQGQENVKEFEKVLAQAKAAHEQERKKLSSEKTAKTQEYEKNLINLKEKFEQESSNLKNEQSLLVKEHEKAIAQIKAGHAKDKEKQLKDFQNMKSEYEKMLDQVKAENSNERENLKNEYEKMLDQVKAENSNERENLKNEFEKLIGSVKAEKAAEKNKFEEIIRNLKGESFEEKQRLVQEMQGSKKEFEQMLKQKELFFTEQQQKWRKELNDNRIEFENLLAQTKENLKSEKENSLQNKSQEFEAIKNQLISKHENEKQKLSTENKKNAEEFETLLSQTQEEHKKHIQSLTQSFDSRLQSKEKHFADQQKSLELSLTLKQRELDQKVSDHLSELTKKDLKIQELSKNLQNLSTDLENLSKHSKDLESKLTQEQKSKTEQAEELWSKYEEMKYVYEQTIITEKFSFEESQKNLEVEIRTLKSEISSLEKEKNGYKEKLQQEQENFLIKMKVLQDENAFLNVQIQQNLEKYKEDLGFSKKKYENLKMVTEKQQELAMQESELVRDQLTQEVAHLSRQMQSINDLRLRENENSSQIIKDIKENMDIVLRNTTDHYESKISELTKELKAMQLSMDTLSDQCDRKIKESNRSFKEITVQKVLSTCEFIENIHPLSAPNSLSH